MRHLMRRVSALILASSLCIGAALAEEPLRIGVISSGDCLAVAPVAEEMKKFTVLFDCATNRIFEEGTYKYVFRTTTMATQENVAAARYISESFPNLKSFSGINPNYAWGQDAWA